MKLFVVLFASVALISATPVPQYPFMPKFGFKVCEKDVANNVVASPASVYTALGLAYLGAEGDTATEMQNVLNFQGKTKEEVAQSYAEFMKKFDIPTYNREVTTFHIANHIFVNQNYEVAPKFNELATKYLQSSAEKVNFAEAAEAAGKINSWVAESTNQKIKNIISADNFDAETAMVLVNAIYFRAHWEHRFSAGQTTKKDFYMSENEKVPVDMMFKEHFYNYAEWEDLNAKAIQIPFVHTDIYMLIVLPNDVNGLHAVQQKFKTANLKALHDTFTEQKVKLSLPKFKYEYKANLNDVLKEIGLASMFTKADFSGLFANDQSVGVSDVIHKAFIAVDEVGTEASAATLIEMGRMGRYYPEVTKVYEFNVDHPFMFAIKDGNYIYFSGHVTHF